MIDILKKCHTDPRYVNNDYLTFLFITLKVQDTHYLFFKNYSFHIFCDFIFLKCQCRVHVLTSRK